MKKYLLAITLVGISSYSYGYGFCGPYPCESNDTGKGQSLTKIDIYRVGYADGYEKGKEEGIEKGWQMAIEYFKEIYKEKLQEYKEIEAGKILVEKWKISYPKVYQVQTTSGSKVVIEGCKIIDSYDDLLAKIPVRPTSFSSNNNNKDETIITNQKTEKIEKIEKEPVIYTKAIVPSKFIDKLANTDAVYLKNSNEDSYTVYFKSQKDKEIFCSSYTCY